jgi:hypothetical protein
VRPGGQLERIVTDLTIGVHRGLQERERALESSRSGPYEQSVQVPINGQASSGWGYVDKAVTWEHPFVYSPAQSRLPFATPHVSHHIEFTRVLSDLVIAHAHVTSWIQDVRGGFIGARVRVASCAPNTTGTVPYAGILHLKFLMQAFPTDDDLNA